MRRIFDLFVKDKKNHMGACAVYVLPRVESLCNKFKDSFPQDVNWKDLLGKSIAKKKVKLPAKRKRGYIYAIVVAHCSLLK